MTKPIVTSITDEQLEDLEKLARKATPGEWWIDSHGHTMVSHGDGETSTIFMARELVKPAVRHPETGNLSHWPNDWDASYIATASPQNIQALIARLRAAEKELSAVKDGANHRAIMSLRAQCEDLKKGMAGDYDLDAWLEFVRDEAQLRKDAARYRWLRETEDWGDVRLPFPSFIVNAREEVINASGIDLDQAVDYAMGIVNDQH